MSTKYATISNGDTIEVRGYEFKISIDVDHDFGAPWEERDCHGLVTDWLTRPKKPNEIILSRENSRSGGPCRFYDLQASVERALNDKWGLAPEELARFTEELGQPPTERQIAARAVHNDIEYLSSWCRDEWSYLYIEVKCTANEMTSTAGAVDSYRAGHLAVIHEMVEQLCNQMDEEIAASAPRMTASGVQLHAPDQQSWPHHFYTHSGGARVVVGDKYSTHAAALRFIEKTELQLIANDVWRTARAEIMRGGAEADAADDLMLGYNRVLAKAGLDPVE